MNRNLHSQLALQPERPTRVLLALFIVGVCSRGAGYYSVAERADPGMWTRILRGTANAPDQYRIGVVVVADWATRHLPHLTMARSFAALDLLASLYAVMLLYSLLLNGEVYRSASLAKRWFASAGFAALVMYLMDWANWYQKVSTLPSALLVAVLLWLWTPSSAEARPVPLLRMAGILTISLLLSFVRADLALFVSLGFLASCLLFPDPPLALPRAWAITTSLAGSLLAAGVQLYLMKVRYPAATYGGVHAFMLPYDWWKLSKWAAVLIFLAPFLWTALGNFRQRTLGRSAGGALILGALGYAVLWFFMGRLDEVRIFLPMALATVALTIETVMRRMGAESISEFET
jgi:hypothetical protein